jgi:glycosyltransferase involved in cell wall biosynthesis
LDEWGEKMKYSVVIPAYNAAQTIVETIDSVLSQSVPPSEVIVVNDGSTDNTLQILSQYSDSVKVLTQRNQGCGKATSLGFQTAKFPIIASVDADDIWLHHKMKVQLDYMSAHPECSIICSQLRLFHHLHPDRENGAIKDGLGRSTLVIRREVYELIGDIIDPTGSRGDLVDWLARCREAGLYITLIPEVLCLRRIIPGSLSYGRNETLDRGYLEVARRAILRKKLTLNADKQNHENE